MVYVFWGPQLFSVYALSLGLNKFVIMIFSKRKAFILILPYFEGAK